ncbi:hypothetical protein [Melghirimyces algeriensis]|uniref:Uncharacterized protein n=1 Tax=Melghirimyces algeriensis TaxID=910412 RepID=A0A521BQA7_9BACL|nr:hypothetical protein [Melghirimyces algeriensis]SMO49327.1 hypothetical protein SAMN06264849_102305 [Melghirimyces algeriensis]
MSHQGTGLRDERGIALPFVLGVTVLAFLLITAALSIFSRSLHGERLDWKLAQAQYAAESGIARMQQKVCTDPSWRRPLSTPMNGIQTHTAVQKIENDTLEIRSIARGDGVKQTITAEVNLPDCTIVRWSS